MKIENVENRLDKLKEEDILKLREFIEEIKKIYREKIKELK